MIVTAIVTLAVGAADSTTVTDAVVPDSHVRRPPDTLRHRRSRAPVSHGSPGFLWARRSPREYRCRFERRGNLPSALDRPAPMAMQLESSAPRIAS